MTAVAQLRRVRAKLVGLILNDMRMNDVRYATYYDSYHQGDEEGSDVLGRRRTKALTAGQG